MSIDTSDFMFIVYCAKESEAKREKEIIIVSSSVFITSFTATIRIFKDESATSTERYISPKNVELSMDYNTISGTLSNNENVCPSVGDVNILVIPVHLPGSEFNTPEIKEDIETAFFGKEDDRNGYMSLTLHVFN